MSVALPFGKRLPVTQVGVNPGPALVRNCPEVPALAFRIIGLPLPLRTRPAFTVSCPLAVERMFVVSTHDVPE